MTDEPFPEWWRTDPEYAQALYALDFLHATHYVRHTDEMGWHIDFEDAWDWPCSSGERILVAHAWCLFNLGWAASVTAEIITRTEGESLGPLWWGNPSRTIGTLDGEHLAVYMKMIEIRRGAADLASASVRLPAISPSR